MPAKKKNKRLAISKNKKILWAASMIVLVAAVVVILVNPNAVNLLSPQGTPKISPSIPTVCGEIELSVKTIQEASAYIRGDLATSAGTGLKYEILQLEATYKGQTEKLLTGYRLEVIDNQNSVAKPISFSSFSKLVPVDKLEFADAIALSCNEFPLGGARSPSVTPNSKLSGCSLFRINSANDPVKLNVYDLNGFLCSVAV